KSITRAMRAARSRACGRKYPLARTVRKFVMSARRPPPGTSANGHCFPDRERQQQAVLRMKWMLVVLVGGVSPVNTDLVFDKFSDCLAAEEQMRQHYADAFDAWDRVAAARIDRRRDYKKARDIEAKRLLGNVGTCVPHGGGDQQPVNAPQPQPPATSPP